MEQCRVVGRKSRHTYLVKDSLLRVLSHWGKHKDEHKLPWSSQDSNPAQVVIYIYISKALNLELGISCEKKLEFKFIHSCIFLLLWKGSWIIANPFVYFILKETELQVQPNICKWFKTFLSIHFDIVIIPKINDLRVYSKKVLIKS